MQILHFRICSVEIKFDQQFTREVHIERLSYPDKLQEDIKFIVLGEV